MATFLKWAMPVPVVAAPGSTQSLSTMLTTSFGESPGWNDFWVTYQPASQLQSWNFSYWNPSNPTVASWYVNGTNIGGGLGNQTYVPGTAVSSAVLHAGNNIADLAYVTVPASPQWHTVYIEYTVITVAPNLLSPVAGLGAPRPQDIVDTTYRFANFYGDGLIPNSNDCHNIAQCVAAGTGAVFAEGMAGPPQGLDPSLNTDAGFWRVAYRGSDPNRFRIGTRWSSRATSFVWAGRTGASTQLQF